MKNINKARVRLTASSHRSRGSRTAIWKYVIPLASAAVIVLVVLVVSGIIGTGILPSSTTKATAYTTGASANPTVTEKPASTSSQIPASVSNQTSTTEPANTTSPENRIVCRVQMDINPSIEFQLAEDQSLINVVGLAEDGVSLIEGIDFKGVSFENAAIIVVNRLIVENYISASVVEDNIFLMIRGESGQLDVQRVMSSVIESAVAQYDLLMNAEKTADNQIRIVLTSKPIEIGNISTPGEDLKNLPVPFRLEIRLTGKKPPNSEVQDVYITFKDGKEHWLNELILGYDFCGNTVGFNTLYALTTLIERGFISDQVGIMGITISLPGYDEASLAREITLVRLVLQEAGFSLDAVRERAGVISIVPSADPAPVRTARYTMTQVLNPMFLKNREDITDLQVQILTLSFMQSEIDSTLQPRYFAVIPNLIGLTEEEAVRLCKLAGFVPKVVREPFSEGSSTEDIGKVFFQDSNAGGIWEVGTKFLVFVLTGPDEETTTGSGSDDHLNLALPFGGAISNFE